MTIDIQTLIEQRPHLKEPFELYAKWQRFQEQAADLLPRVRSAVAAEESRAYPRESTGPIFELFSSIFDLPAKDFAPLRRALDLGEVDFMRLPLDELPEIDDLACSKEELASLLFLFSRPYFLALRESFPLDGSEWEEGRCPLCSAPAALATISEGPKRRLHCSFCATSGPYRHFIGCPSCGSVNVEQLTTVLSDDEPGFRVTTCDHCQSYLKIFENSVLKEMTIDLADLASIPLDIVVQGKNFVRRVANPISLKIMK
jgi:FdhE protein